MKQNEKESNLINLLLLTILLIMRHMLKSKETIFSKDEQGCLTRWLTIGKMAAFANFNNYLINICLYINEKQEQNRSLNEFFFSGTFNRENTVTFGRNNYGQKCYMCNKRNTEKSNICICMLTKRCTNMRRQLLLEQSSFYFHIAMFKNLNS